MQGWEQEKESMLKVFGLDFVKLLLVFQDASGYVALHVQVITDFKTIEEIVEKYCEMFIN